MVQMTASPAILSKHDETKRTRTVLDKQQLYREVLDALGSAELQTVKSLIGSSTLRDAVRLIVEESEARARLFIPHYWAIYYHDGRGSVHPVNSSKLVFFDNPQDDPRIPGGRSPERANQLRRLTRAEYLQGLEINADRRASRQRPYMYVVDSVGDAAAHPFFDRLAEGAASRAGATVLPIFDRHIQFWIDSDPSTRPETKIADFRF